MPLTFDLPFEQLSSYNGKNPCPPNFDEYWDASLAEMRSIEPNIELVPADFQAPNCECFHFYFTGVGNARVHAKLIRPKNAAKPHPAVLMFHGYTGDSGDWTDKISYAAAGFTVAALDCRGQAGLSQDPGNVAGNTLNGHIIRGLEDALNGRPEKLYYRNVFLDTAQLARIVMKMEDVDPTKVTAMGGSQGGALTVACAALEPRIKRAAPLFPFLSDYLRVWQMDQAKDAYKELQEYFRHADPRHLTEAQVFENLGYIDIQHLAKRVQAQILWGIGLMDTICPPSTQFAVYNKIKSPKKMIVYPDFAHESIPGWTDQAYQFIMGV